DRSWRPFDHEVWIVLQRQNRVRRDRIDGSIRAAFAKFQRASGRVGHHQESHAWNMRRLAPVVWIALYDYVLVLLHADEPERPASHRMLIEVLLRPCGDDSARSIRHVPQQRSICMLHLEHDGVRVRRFDMIDKLVSLRFSGSELTAKNGIECELHIG